jgi:hypothetical protein
MTKTRKAKPPTERTAAERVTAERKAQGLETPAPFESAVSAYRITAAAIAVALRDRDEGQE